MIWKELVFVGFISTVVIVCLVLAASIPPTGQEGRRMGPFRAMVYRLAKAINKWWCDATERMYEKLREDDDGTYWG